LENLRVEDKQLPYKSESMGLLDAEGYKFLEASDSNSDDVDCEEIEDQENNFDGQELKRQRRSVPPQTEIIYEMRPPMSKKKQRKPLP
jgi:hypothetical protein